MLIEKFTSFFEGELRFFLETSPENAANLLLFSDIAGYNEEWRKDGYCISTSDRDGKKLKKICDEQGICYSVLYQKGARRFIKNLTKRPGLFFGAIFALFLLYQSSQYVWQIQVYGTEELSYAEVVEILENHGFYIGCKYKNIDMHMLCNSIPITNEKIAWISVNMMGSVAEVQVVEYHPKPEETKPIDKNGLVNLVANHAGQIVGFELSSGRVVAGIGKTVEEGELLVAGFSEKETGLHPRVAVGKVFAKTVLYEETFIPYQYTVKTPDPPEKLSKTIFFLEKSLIIFKNSRFSEEEYDIMIDKYSPTVMGISLPMRILEKYAVTYKETVLSRSKEEATRLAKETLYGQINEKTDQLLEDRFFFYPEKDGLRAVLMAECVINIATPVAVEMGEQP